MFLSFILYGLMYDHNLPLWILLFPQELKRVSVETACHIANESCLTSGVHGLSSLRKGGAIKAFQNACPGYFLFQ